MHLLPLALSMVMPGQAQDIDIRRIDIHTGLADANCGFGAYPGLRLQLFLPQPDLASASWSAPAEGADANGFTMQLVLSQRASRRAGFDVASWWVATRGRPVSARLSLDGADVPMTLVIGKVERGRHAIWAADSDVATLGALLVNAAEAELRWFDSKGAPLGRARWDIRAVRDFPRLLERVDWRCVDPVR